MDDDKVWKERETGFSNYISIDNMIISLRVIKGYCKYSSLWDSLV